MNLVKPLNDLLSSLYPSNDVRLLETHISWVFLTGTWAYKFKKPIQTPFLNYSTLSLRKSNCEEELRINRRFAPSIYDSVIAVYSGPAGLNLNGEGEVVEYAVRMREFPQSALLLEMLKEGLLTEIHFRSLAEELARMHAQADHVSPSTPWGTSERVIADALENFQELNPLLPSEFSTQLARLRTFVEAKAIALASDFQRRRETGKVRDCHGDLHLGNLIWYEGRVQAFDGIEFSAGLRWIDLVNDLAFVLMDLDEHGARSSSNRVLNQYLQASGDWDGLRVLKFYKCYRAMVRAKTSAIRAAQSNGQGHFGTLWQATAAYLEVSQSISQESVPVLAITHGFSGSGKSHGTEPLLDIPNVIRIRSDIERKRRAGLAPLDPSDAELSQGIYEPQETEATYRYLAEAALASLQGGFHVIVDACFLKERQRLEFRNLATKIGSPFHILHFDAEVEILRSRILSRQLQNRDASEATLEVLELQIHERQPLNRDEIPACITLSDFRDILAKSSA